jgi:hypothetical protein
LSGKLLPWARLGDYPRGESVSHTAWEELFS